MPKIRLEEATSFYQNYSYPSVKTIWEVSHNALRMIKGVYRFKHFEDYISQKKSSKQEDKKSEYWTASYHELIIDYIKISIAFENYNKVELIRNGYLIHKIDKNFNAELFKIQDKGIPVKITDFLSNNFTTIEKLGNKARLNGLNKKLFTISYLDTLNENYQDTIGLEPQFIFELKKINKKRNQLHFFIDFKGASHVDHYIAQWTYIKDMSLV
jgi:hypothetical protein